MTYTWTLASKLASHRQESYLNTGQQMSQSLTWIIPEHWPANWPVTDMNHTWTLASKLASYWHESYLNYHQPAKLGRIHYHGQIHTWQSEACKLARHRHRSYPNYHRLVNRIPPTGRRADVPHLEPSGLQGDNAMHTHIHTRTCISSQQKEHGAEWRRVCTR